MRLATPSTVAVAPTTGVPAGSFPRTWNVTVRVPAESTITIRCAESATRPAGTVSATDTDLRDISADLSVTLKKRSSGTPARAISTVRSSDTLIAGATATGR